MDGIRAILPPEEICAGSNHDHDRSIGACPETHRRSVRAADLPLLRPPVYNARRARSGGRTLTHRECRPYRPRHQPRWSPSRHAHGFAQVVHPPLQLVKLAAAPDLGPVRVNFRYNNRFATSADFCEKSSRQQFCEEAHEIAWRRWAIVNVNCTDLQFQPIEATFVDTSGKRVSAFWDLALEFYDGSLTFAEIKADETFFLDPAIRRKADASASALSRHGYNFARLHGSDFDGITKETIKQVFDSRRTAFDVQQDLGPVINAVSAAGGQISMGMAVALIGGPRAQAEAKLCAMMVRRHIALDLAQPLTDCSLVTLAPEAIAPGQLRRFLSRFVSTEGEDE